MGRLGRFFSTTAATLTAVGIVQAALAADLPVPAPASAPRTVNWTGLYVGGSISAAFDSARFTQPLSGLIDTSIGTINANPAYSVYGGANYQVLPWAVLGVEANYTWLTDATYRYLGPALDFLDKTNHIDSVDGRIGVLLRPDTMIYGKAGWAQIEVQGFQNFGMSFHQILPAVQFGGGIESLVTPNIALRADVSYTYADRLLTLNSNTDLYRPGFLMVGVGAEYKFDVPGLGAPATFASGASAPSAKSKMVFKAPPLPPPVVGPNWTGIEFGGFVSANGNKSRYTDTLLPGELGPFTQFDIGGGWFIGANYQYQRFVVGIEGSGNYENAKFNTPAGSGGLVGNFYQFAKVEQVLALTGRAGWLMTPDTLLYIKGGPAAIRMTPDAQYWNSIAPNSNATAHELGGYVVGFGVETYVMPQVSVRLEGLYAHTDQNIVLQGTVPNEFTLQPSILTATLGAAYHF